MNCLLVPSLGYDLSLPTRLAESIDYPIKSKVLVNTGNPHSFDDWAVKHPDWQVLHVGVCPGPCAVWNMAPQLWPDEPAWIIVNDDETFMPGCLEKLCRESDAHCHDNTVIYVNQYDAYDLFVWTRLGVETLGYFDENYWPQYFDDYDYRARIFAIGAPVYNIPGPFPVKHGRERSAGPRCSKMLDLCTPFNRRYFCAKWNWLHDQNQPDSKSFKTPFNKGGWVGDWKIDWRRRSILRAFWDEFWNKTPSYYE